MKFIAVLFFVCLMAGSKGYAQTVTLSVKDAPLESVLRQFKKQTGYSFFYDESILKRTGKITLNLKNAPIAIALKECLGKQPTLSYDVVGNTVVITEKEDSTPRKIPDSAGFTIKGAAAITIHGTVYNARYEKLANASVQVRGTQKGTLTKADGTFLLEDLKPADALKVSFIGYKAQELPINGQTELIIILQDANSELDQVVLQGYSRSTQRLSTSSISKVTAAELERQPVMNPLLALQGRVPGLVITPVTGYASGPVIMDIRGKSLLSGRADNPLIVVDGTPITIAANSGLGSAYDGPVQGYMALLSPSYGQSPLFGLNPRDIESIEVLKDAGTTAMYGSSGANGVILITTKKGKAGTSQTNINVNTGFSKIIRYWDMLNTTQYLQMRREAFKNDGITPTLQNAPDLLLWDSTRNVDWQKEYWGNTGKNTSVDISVSGGTPQLTHRLAVNYNRQEDIMAASGGNEVMGAALSLGRKSTDQKFSATLSAGYNYSLANMVRSPDVSTFAPNAPAIFDEAGNLNYTEWNAAGLGEQFTSFSRLLSPYEFKTNKLSSNLDLNYNLFRGFTIRTTLGYQMAVNNSISTEPISSKNPKYYPTGSSMFSKTNSSSWIIEPQLNYNTRIPGQGSLSIIAGTSIRQAQNDNSTQLAYGYTNDALLRSVSNALYIISMNTATQYKAAALFGRMEYVWDNKYVVNLSGRRDGSSRFGPGNQFGNFGAVGAAWIMSDENWFKQIIAPYISFFKLRGNYGSSGNDGGQDYQYLSQWGKGFNNYSYNNIAPITSLHAVNQDYHWQQSKELNLGLDLRLLKNGSLSLAVNYYRKRIDNQLVNNPTAAFTGFTSVFGNWPASIQNTGWEFSLNANIINKENLSWSVSFNGAFNKNVLRSYPDIAYSPFYTQYLTGQPITKQYLLDYIGVDPLTGQYQFRDFNHDGILSRQATGAPLSGNTDLQLAIDMAPEFTGGIGSSFFYKKFSLNVNFDIKVQKGRNAYSNTSTPGGMSNIALDIYNDHWQKPGDVATYSRFTTLNSQQFAQSLSDLAITDASFIRLTNTALSYNLPEKLAQKIRMNECRVNLYAQNLFVITRYKGLDPETQTFGAMPPARIISAGLSFTF